MIFGQLDRYIEFKLGNEVIKVTNCNSAISYIKMDKVNDLHEEAVNDFG